MALKNLKAMTDVIANDAAAEAAAEADEARLAADPMARLARAADVAAAQPAPEAVAPSVLAETRLADPAIAEVGAPIDGGTEVDGGTADDAETEERVAAAIASVSPSLAERFDALAERVAGTAGAEAVSGVAHDVAAPPEAIGTASAATAAVDAAPETVETVETAARLEGSAADLDPLAAEYKAELDEFDAALAEAAQDEIERLDREAQARVAGAEPASEGETAEESDRNVDETRSRGPQRVGALAMAISGMMAASRRRREEARKLGTRQILAAMEGRKLSRGRVLGYVARNAKRDAGATALAAGKAAEAAAALRAELERVGVAGRIRDVARRAGVTPQTVTAGMVKGGRFEAVREEAWMAGGMADPAVRAAYDAAGKAFDDYGRAADVFAKRMRSNAGAGLASPRLDEAAGTLVEAQRRRLDASFADLPADLRARQEGWSERIREIMERLKAIVARLFRLGPAAPRAPEEGAPEARERLEPSFRP